MVLTLSAMGGDGIGSQSIPTELTEARGSDGQAVSTQSLITSHTTSGSGHVCFCEQTHQWFTAFQLLRASALYPSIGTRISDARRKHCGTALVEIAALRWGRGSSTVQVSYLVNLNIILTVMSVGVRGCHGCGWSEPLRGCN